MPDDLIIKFFREDLTEAEEAALDEQISSSEEDALRFGQHAEASYRHYGLPEPEWPGGPPPKGFLPGAGWKPGVWMVVALLAGLLAWGFWKYGVPVKTAFAAFFQAPEAPSQPIAPGSPKVLKHEAPSESLPDSMAGEESAPAASLAEALPMTTPVNLASQAPRPHSNLEVVVNHVKTGAVTVRVIGPDGTQAAMLYQGALQPGSWAFDWNGRSANGEASPAGIYQIQVISGAVTLSKNVPINNSR